MKVFCKIIDLPKTQYLVIKGWSNEDRSYTLTSAFECESGVRSNVTFSFFTQEDCDKAYDLMTPEQAQKIFDNINNEH